MQSPNMYYALHACFCMLGADSHAQSVLSNKIPASELRRKFAKSALLVGHASLEVPPALLGKIWAMADNQHFESKLQN